MLKSFLTAGMHKQQRVVRKLDIERPRVLAL